MQPNSPESESNQSDPEGIETLLARAVRTLRGSHNDRLFGILLVVNLIFLFARPQYDFRFLESIMLPFLLSAPLGLVWLLNMKKTWCPQVRAMIALVIFGAIWVPLARNNFWAFERFRTFALLFSCYIFPIILLCQNSRNIKRFVAALFFLGFYLGLYSLRSAGCGPGDFMGDENDFCTVLILFLCFPMLMFPTVRSGLGRVALVLVIIALLAGIVRTDSRGGFIGLVFSLLYIFWVSESKLLYSMLFVLIAAGAALLAPAEYWDEIRSIQETDQGTAAERRKIWEVARRIWYDPKHFIWGVGMGNATYWLADYEPAEHFSSAERSVSGRAIHSLYFEMLPDTGCIGLGIFLTVVITSMRGNSRLKKRSQRLNVLISRLLANRAAAVSESAESAPDRSVSIDADVAELLIAARGELRYISSFASGLNATWPGVLSSAAFISIFYYPIIWFIGGTSAGIQIYHKRIERALEPLVTEIEQRWESVP